MREKKLLFLSTREFWVMNGGHQYEIYHYLRGLHEKYGYTIFVYTFSENDGVPCEMDIPNFIKNVEYSKRVTKLDIVKNAICHMLSISNPWPLQNMLFYSRKNKRFIKKYIKEIEPQVIYVDMLRLATYECAFRNLNCLKVLGYDDLLSERYNRQINCDSSNMNVAGAYSDRLSPKILAFLKKDHIRRVILQLEARRMEKSERFYAERFDSGIFVSDLETKKFNEKLGRSMAHTVSMGIDFDYQSENIEYDPIPSSFSYVGNMKTAANYETVMYIIEKILPHVKSDYLFYIIGTCPDDIVNRYKDNKRIRFTGKVNDLRPYIKATTVFFAPIAFGTGIKTKILEAFAMGMPVITNSVGIEGIEAENGVHCLIENDTKALAQSLDLLINSPIKREQLARNAQLLARGKYQWETNWKGFAEAGF